MKNLKKSFSELLEKKETSPLAQASCIWSIVSDQLEILLGQEVFDQWFKPITPLVVSDNTIFLKTKNEFSSYWIELHYKNLVDTLLKCQEEDIFASFLDEDTLVSQNKKR